MQISAMWKINVFTLIFTFKNCDVLNLCQVNNLYAGIESQFS